MQKAVESTLNLNKKIEKMLQKCHKRVKAKIRRMVDKREKLGWFKVLMIQTYIWYN